MTHRSSSPEEPNYEDTHWIRHKHGPDKGLGL